MATESRLQIDKLDTDNYGTWHRRVRASLQSKDLWTTCLGARLGAICVLFTSYYSFRLLFLTFLSPTNLYKSSLKSTHDAPFVMALP